MLVKTRDGRLWETSGDYVIGRDFSIGRDPRRFYFGQDPRRFYFGNDRGNGEQQALMELERQALAREAGGFTAREQEPMLGNKIPLPIQSDGDIAAGAEGVARALPQNSIKLETLLIPALIAGAAFAENWTILSLQVGTDNQFVSDGEIPGGVFSTATQQNVQLKGSTANLGTQITMRIRNESAGPLTFRGTILGPVIRSFG